MKDPVAQCIWHHRSWRISIIHEMSWREQTRTAVTHCPDQPASGPRSGHYAKANVVTGPLANSSPRPRRGGRGRLRLLRSRRPQTPYEHRSATRTSQIPIARSPARPHRSSYRQGHLHPVMPMRVKPWADQFIACAARVEQIALLMVQFLQRAWPVQISAERSPVDQVMLGCPGPRHQSHADPQCPALWPPSTCRISPVTKAAFSR